MQSKRFQKIHVCTYGAVSIGVLLGCLLFLSMICMGKTLLLDYGLEDYNLSVMFNASEDKIMIHIIQKRLLQIAIFILLLYLTTYYCSCFLFCSGFGIYYGFVICNLIIKYKLLGLGYGFVCFFPHYFMYFLAIYLIGKWVEEQKNVLRNCYSSMNVLENGIKIFLIFMLTVLAIVWEIKFQKNFLNYFFQYLV